MADLIVVLEKGCVAAAGHHATLLAQGRFDAEFYELQARAGQAERAGVNLS